MSSLESSRASTSLSPEKVALKLQEIQNRLEIEMKVLESDDVFILFRFCASGCDMMRGVD